MYSRERAQKRLSKCNAKKFLLLLRTSHKLRLRTTLTYLVRGQWTRLSTNKITDGNLKSMLKIADAMTICICDVTFFDTN